MAGRGPAPKDTGARRRSNTPERGDWQAPAGWGWQHGEIPGPPSGLLKRSVDRWHVWFRSWYAANWTADYLPQLELTIQYFDQVQRSIDSPFIEADGPRGATMYFRRPCPMTELRQNMDSLGITLKGQQDRRWKMPPAPGTETDDKPRADARPEPYAGLRAVK